MSLQGNDALAVQVAAGMTTAALLTASFVNLRMTPHIFASARGVFANLGVMLAVATATFTFGSMHSNRDHHTLLLAGVSVGSEVSEDEGQITSHDHDVSTDVYEAIGGGTELGGFPTTVVNGASTGCRATALTTHFFVIAAVALLTMDAVDNSFLLSSHKDPVKRTTYLLVISSYAFAVFIVGVSYLMAPEQYGVVAVYPRNISIVSETEMDFLFGGGQDVDASIRSEFVINANSGGGGYCWIGGGVLAWGLVAPLLLTVMIALYSTLRALSFLRHDATVINEGLVTDGIAATKFTNWDRAREFETLRRRANHLLLQLQAGNHRLRTNLVLWSLVSTGWIFATASNVATTLADAVLYELIYVLLTCLQGAALLGMAMLDPQRDRNVTIMLFPPDQTVLDVLRLKSDLGTHLPQQHKADGSGRSRERQHADIDVLWGADGKDLTAAVSKKDAGGGVAAAGAEGGAGQLDVPQAKFAHFGRPETPRHTEGLRKRGVSAINKGTVQSLIQKFAILESDEGGVSGPPPSGLRRSSSFSKRNNIGGSRTLPPAPTASQVVYLSGGGGGGGLASRAHTYESVKSVPPQHVDYPADASKEAESKKAAELIAGAARRRQSDAVAIKAAEAESLLEAVRVAQDMLATRGGNSNIVSASTVAAVAGSNTPSSSMPSGASSVQAVLDQGHVHASYTISEERKKSVLGAANTADEALLIATTAASEGRGVSPSRKRFGSLEISGGSTLMAEAFPDPAVGMPPTSSTSLATASGAVDLQLQRRPANPTAALLLADSNGASRSPSPPPSASPSPPPSVHDAADLGPAPAPYPTTAAAAVAAASSTANQFAMSQIAADLTALAQPPQDLAREPSTPGRMGQKETLQARQAAAAVESFGPPYAPI